MQKRGYLTLGQILILVLGVIAFSYIIGGEFGLVSGVDVGSDSINTLTDWYTSKNQALPSLEDRAKIYQGRGLLKKGETYTGTFEQNIKLLNALKTSAETPAPVQTETATPNPIQSKSAQWLIDEMGWKTNNALLFGNIAGGIGYAMSAGAIISFFAPLLEVEGEELDALNSAVVAGIILGKTTQGLLSPGGYLNEFFTKEGLTQTSANYWSVGVGIIIAAAVYYATYEKTKQEIITFTCNPWTAPSGGENCELCNSQEFPCSEYQCMSLGEACELINVGTGEEKCTWKDPYDSSPPIISTFDDALLNEKYQYTPDGAISPPDRGVIIEYSETRDNCIPPFTPFSFGIQLDEPAKCRIDYARKQTYDEMSYNFGGSPLFKYNHTNIMSLPSPSSLENENITLENGGIFNIYVKCQDPNGNYNVNDFVFRFCVDDSPDTTPPIIEVTNPTNNAPIRNNQTEIETSIYLNEPSTCRWSHSSQKYDQMTNDMNCVTSAMQMNAQMLYECAATLDGIMNNQNNKYYFACKDKPNANEEDRNENQVFEYNLIGTDPLYIDSVTPNDTTVSNASEAVRTTIKVKTEQGYNDGESKCYFSDTEDSGFIEFAETGSYEHVQDLWLSEGSYEYFIKCVDAGGNTDEETIIFDVDSDTEVPFVARALKLGEQLVIITNEPGRCVYSPIDCKYVFDDGINFVSNGDGMEHYVTWESDKVYYIKCKDDFENYPAGDECNLVVRPLTSK